MLSSMDPHHPVQHDEASSGKAAHNFFQGNSFNAQGNVYVSGFNTREEPEKSLYDTLAYEGMNARAEQLSLPTIPTESFDWIWTTKFKAWLSDDAPFFWISGKPGSGKSTLVHYLVRTKRTQDLLERKNTAWTIVDFFFDFRAGKTAANDLHGILRKFLLQLCDKFPSVQARLTERVRNRAIEANNLHSLIDTFCETVRSLKSRLCLFVDGLDEFEGHFSVLVETLTTMQDRTGAKVCIASRPEPTFIRMFERFPSLKMQDHNMASIRVYINRAIDKGRDELSNVDTIFDTKLREEILTRAQGVIVWARLAIDEVLIATQSNMPHAQIRALLDKLPLDLELMYDRCLARIRWEHAAEASTLLYLLNEFGGALENAFFSQLWNFICIHSVKAPVLKPSSNQTRFVQRVATLLGVFIDVLEESNSVRVLHKTLLSYLSKSERLRSMLPPEFKKRFAPFTKFKIYSAVMFDAMTGLVDDSSVIEEWRWTVLDTRLRKSYGPVPRSLGGGNDWESKTLLVNSIQGLPSAIRAMAWWNQEDAVIVQKALSSSLMLYTLVHEDYFYEYQRLLLPYVKQQGVVDLWFAISLGLCHYVRQRLRTVQHEKAHLWDVLFGYGITCMIRDPTLGGSSHPYFPARKRIAWLIRYHWEYFGIKSVFLCDTLTTWIQRARHVQRSIITLDIPLEVCEIVLSIKPSEMSAIHGIRKDCYCACGVDHALHSWTSTHTHLRRWKGYFGAQASTMGVLLYCLFQTNTHINAVCVNSGTVMHQLFVTYAANARYYDYTSNEGIGFSRTIAMLARLGVDPNIRFKNQTPLDQAKALRKKQTLEFMATVGRRGSFQSPPLTHLIKILEYHKRHGQWPDFTELEARWPELKHYHLDESGHFPLENDFIDDIFTHRTEEDEPILDGNVARAPTSEEKARWVSILSRHKNGTLYADMEPQCKEWLESDEDV